MNRQIVIICGCLVRDSKVLLVQRDEEECPEAHLKWEFPGGKVDFGETLEESLTREFLEETGRRVRVRRIIPFTQTVYWKYDWGTQQTLCFYYLCELIKEGRPKIKDHHVRQVKWVNLEEARSLSSLPGTKEVLSLVREGLIR